MRILFKQGVKRERIQRQRKAERVRTFLKIRDGVLDVMQHQKLTIIATENGISIYTDADLAKWWDAACMRLKGSADSLDAALLAKWPAGRTDESEPAQSKGEEK